MIDLDYIRYKYGNLSYEYRLKTLSYDEIKVTTLVSDLEELIQCIEEAKEIISKAELDAYCCNKWNREWLDKYFHERKP